MTDISARIKLCSP